MAKKLTRKELEGALANCEDIIGNRVKEINSLKAHVEHLEIELDKSQCLIHITSTKIEK